MPAWKARSAYGLAIVRTKSLHRRQLVAFCSICNMCQKFKRIRRVLQVGRGNRFVDCQLSMRYPEMERRFLRQGQRFGLPGKSWP